MMDIKSKIKKYIEQNDESNIETLLSNNDNLNRLKEHKYFDPFVMCVRSNNLNLINYFKSKDFQVNTTTTSKVTVWKNSNEKKKHKHQQQHLNNKKKRKFDDDIKRLKFIDHDYDTNSTTTSTTSTSDECEEYDNDNYSENNVEDKSEEQVITTSYSNGLSEAIKYCNKSACELLISLNATINPTDYKHIPLQIAYNLYQKAKLEQINDRFQTYFEIIKLLINNNAIINIYNNEGLRLIHQVTLDRNYDLLKLLIDSQRCYINALTYGKMQNALHLISEERKTRNPLNSSFILVPCVSSLPAPSPSPHENYVHNMHVLQRRSQKEIDEMNNAENELTLKIAKLLINAECNMDHRDYILHETPIFRAIVTNSYELVKLFVVEGINLNQRNIFGNDALSRSVQLGRFKIARLLLRVGSVVRKATCFYKMPKTLDTHHELLNNNEDNDHDYAYNLNNYPFNLNMGNSSNNNQNSSSNNDENMMLMNSLHKYEEFVKYVKFYTQDQPRSLIDLSRLCVRRLVKKPISKHISTLNLPSRVNDFLLLKDID